MCRYCIHNADAETITLGLNVHSAYERAAHAMRELESALKTYAQGLPADVKPATLDQLKNVVKTRRRLNREYAAYRPGETPGRLTGRGSDGQANS